MPYIFVRCQMQGGNLVGKTFIDFEKGQDPTVMDVMDSFRAQEVPPHNDGHVTYWTFKPPEEVGF